MTAALEGGEWSAERPGRILGKDQLPIVQGLGGPRAGLDGWKNSSPPGLDLDRPARSQSLYRLSYRPNLSRIFKG